MKRTLTTFALIVVGFLALYALTAQRGFGWGDSGEFQYRVLECTKGGAVSGAESFATAHPLYVALAQWVCRTPFHVTLLSSFFGALAVGGFFLCTRKPLLTVVFGLSHMLWWLSCLAEVQTMNLAFTVFETVCLLRFLETDRRRWLVATLFLAGVHLNCHNFALLALPVYAVLGLRAGAKAWIPGVLAWAAGAFVWLMAFLWRGPMDVLVGRYGHQVAGVLPQDWTVTGFNLALAGLSLVVPVAIVWWNRRVPRGAGGGARHWALWALFAINALFFIRYFVPDQATFVLPTLFFAYLLISGYETRRDRAISLAVMQLVLPLLAYQVLIQLPHPERRQRHKYRNDAAYFALPWKFNDDSADRYAAEFDAKWNGYPDCGGMGKPR